MTCLPRCKPFERFSEVLESLSTVEKMEGGPDGNDLRLPQSMAHSPTVTQTHRRRRRDSLYWGLARSCTSAIPHWSVFFPSELTRPPHLQDDIATIKDLVKHPNSPSRRQLKEAVVPWAPIFHERTAQEIEGLSLVLTPQLRPVANLTKVVRRNVGFILVGALQAAEEKTTSFPQMKTTKPPTNSRVVRCCWCQCQVRASCRPDPKRSVPVHVHIRDNFSFLLCALKLRDREVVGCPPTEHWWFERTIDREKKRASMGRCELRLNCVSGTGGAVIGREPT